jgi:hypothetical protein
MTVSAGRSILVLVLSFVVWRADVAGRRRPAEGETPVPIIELRQYTLHPGQREALITLFETEFIESQEAVGMRIVGQFRDLDNPDRFVWVRGFTDFAARAEQLSRFYSGEVWQAHRAEANATMVDSDNVLLLRAARPGSGFAPADHPRPPRGSTDASTGVVVATIYAFAGPVDPAFAAFFDEVLGPHLRAAGIPVVASFVTEPRPNNYPRLPVREHEHVFVWFTRFADAGEADRRMAALTASSGWRGVAETLRRKLVASPEVLRLQPTPRSQLHD